MEGYVLAGSSISRFILGWLFDFVEFPFCLYIYALFITFCNMYICVFNPLDNVSKPKNCSVKEENSTKILENCSRICPDIEVRYVFV